MNINHMFVITEILLKSDGGMRIDGYTFYSKAREGKNGGGVGVLVRNDINASSAPHNRKKYRNNMDKCTKEKPTTTTHCSILWKTGK